MTGAAGIAGDRFMVSTETLTLLLCTLSIACTQQSREPVIARVGVNELTLREALTHIDTTRGNREQQLGAYASFWVDAELIYQEAERMKMDQPEGLDDRMRELRRQLVNQSFLDRQIYSEPAQLTGEEIHSYFEKHLAEFALHEDMVKLRFVIFRSRELAAEFVSRIARNSDWEVTLHDSALTTGMITSTAAGYFSQHTLFPTELWKIATSLSPNEVSFPVKTGAGYAVVKTLEMVRHDTPSPYDLVADEVRQRMIMEQRRSKYTDLIGTLRKRYGVEIFTGVTQPADTTQFEGHD